MGEIKGKGKGFGKGMMMDDMKGKGKGKGFEPPPFSPRDIGRMIGGGMRSERESFDRVPPRDERPRDLGRFAPPRREDPRDLRDMRRGREAPRDRERDREEEKKRERE